MALFFTQPRIRRFNYKPRYWNPEEEERKQRQERARKELQIAEDSDTYIHDVRAKLRGEYNKRKATRGGGVSRRTFRLFLILMILLLAMFYLLSYKLEAILRYFN